MFVEEKSIEGPVQLVEVNETRRAEDMDCE